MLKKVVSFYNLKSLQSSFNGGTGAVWLGIPMPATQPSALTAHESTDHSTPPVSARLVTPVAGSHRGPTAIHRAGVGIPIRGTRCPRVPAWISHDQPAFATRGRQCMASGIRRSV